MWNRLNRGGIRILDLTVIMVGQDWMTELKKEEEEGNLTVCVSDSPATTSIRIIVSHAVDNEKTRGRDLWASTQNGVRGGGLLWRTRWFEETKRPKTRRYNVIRTISWAEMGGFIEL